MNLFWFLGKQIHEAIENGVSQYPKLDGRFLQVSGLAFAFDPSKKPGNRINPDSIRIQKEEVKLEANPYEWNVGIEFGWGGGLQTSSGKDVENEIKDAHFAIIMDFGKIKKSEFVKKYEHRRYFCQ